MIHHQEKLHVTVVTAKVCPLCSGRWASVWGAIQSLVAFLGSCVVALHNETLPDKSLFAAWQQPKFSLFEIFSLKESARAQKFDRKHED